MLTPKVLGAFLIIVAVLGYIASTILESKLILFYSCMSLLFGIAACVRILANPATLKKKYFILVGLDSDVGQEMASSLCAVGAMVFVIQPDAGGEACKRLKERYPNNVIPIECDWKSDDYLSAVEQVEETLQNKTLKGIVFASDDLVRADAELIPMARIAQLLDTNVVRPVGVVKAFLALLRESRGRVVFLGHTLGRFALPAFSAYAMTKFALEGFADGLRREMQRFDVKVVTVERCGHERLGADPAFGEAMWAHATTDARHTYGEEYVRAIAQERGSDQAPGPVVAALLEALAADNPKDRYLVCPARRRCCLRKLEAVLGQLLPATLMDLWAEAAHGARLPACRRLPPPEIK